MRQPIICAILLLLAGSPVATARAQQIPPECLDQPLGTPCPGLDVGVELADEPSFDRSTPGALIINAQDGNGVLVSPHDGLTFASQNDAIAWAQANLNGTVVYDASGQPTGVSGSLRVFGKLFYADDADQMPIEVTDYVAYALGGRTGIVTVAGTAYCLREDGCMGKGMTLKAKPPEEQSVCADSATRFCIESSSWKTEVPPSPFPTIYRSIGSDSEQTEGGFQVSHHFCWKAVIIPWVCKKKKGSNTMTVNNRYRVSLPAFDDPRPTDPRPTPPLGTTFELDEAGEANNVESVTISQWGLFGGFKVSADSIAPKFGGTAEGTITGVCGAESSRAEGLFASTATASGNVIGVCE